MSSFLERSVIPATREAHWTLPDEQVPAWLADVRLERREEARKRAKNRTGDRRD